MHYWASKGEFETHFGYLACELACAYNSAEALNTVNMVLKSFVFMATYYWSSEHVGGSPIPHYCLFLLLGLGILLV